MITVIFFDAGGVLFKQDRHVFEAFDRENHFESGRSREAWGRYLDLAHDGTIRAPEEFTSFPSLKEIISRLHQTNESIPGMIDILKSLTKSYRLGVISNFTPDLDEVLLRMGVLSFFEQVINSSLEGVKKPSHAIYRIACTRCKVLPAETLVIDDTVDNITAARAFGMDAILFTSSAQLRTQLRDRGVMVPRLL